VATRLAAAQAGLGHSVSLFSYGEPGAKERIAQMMSSLPGPGRVGRLTAERGGIAESLLGRNAGRSLRTSAPGFDVLHLHGVWETALVAAAAAARGAGRPYCVTPHGMLDPWCLQQRALKKRVALALAFGRMLNGAAFLHTLNTDERDLLGPLGLRAPAEVIPNGVFLSEIDPLPAPGTFRAAHAELGSDPYILFLSRLHFKKGLDHLADAFAAVLKAIPTARLVVAGPDDGEREPFERRARDRGVAARTHLVGPLYGRDKIAAYVDASVFCLPSRQEGFSVAITESLACGTPVVISPECHFPEVRDAQAGLIAPLDPALIASELLRVLGDASLAKRMSAAGRRLVEERYTWPRIAQVCVDAYGRHASR
jgi:glycosyltransferase involved in cell wall biosynthesis